jgi:hypothetical protein
MASALDTEPSAPELSHRRTRFSVRGLPTAASDAALAAVLALATLFVHSIHYLLSQTFWLDEAWVAVSTRVPLRQVPHVTSVTPLGWTLLLRGSRFGGQQDLRLLPLAFSVLSVAVAYLIGRTLPWGPLWWRRVVGILTALAVLLAPSSLARNDLKPYTADAFVTLSVLLLVALLEAQWNRKRLAVLAGACVVGFTISTVAPFVTAAAFGSLLVVALARRNWRRLIEVAVAGVATAIVLGGIYILAYQSHVQKNLTQFWKDFYPPISKGIGPTLHYLHFRGNEMASYLGMGPLIVALILVAAGVFTIARSGRPSLAFATPILLLEMMVAGAAKKYPLFDQRTSYFMTVCFAVFAAVGVAGLCSLLVRSNVRRGMVAGVTVAAVAAAAFVVNVRHDIRERSILVENIRASTNYVAAHRQPKDVVLVDATASYGFSYYWPVGHPTWRPSTSYATGFQTWFPEQPQIIVATNRDESGIASAIGRAMTQAEATPGARIWIVRTHVTVKQDRLWKSAIGRERAQLDAVMFCSLMVLTPGTSATAPLGAQAQAAACFR